MTAGCLLLAIDQGTTSSRAVVFSREGRALGLGQTELPQMFPRPGWVEHDGERIWADTLAACRQALERAGASPSEVAAVGIANQRETTLLWERTTGRLVHSAIVWQDRRTAEWCAALRERGMEPMVQRRTGLLLDPYFSAGKLAWLLDHVEGARAAAKRGDLAFGTIDTWLLWKLTGGRVHATDATNAARTLLFDIHRGGWDEELLALFDIPSSVLPEVRDSSGWFGDTEAGLFGRAIPITGIAGDQQAAAFGQSLYEPGMVKGTYGTGGFLLLNTGDRPVASDHRLLTTVAWRIDGRTTYALEGSFFVAGAAVQWLRDELGLIEDAAQTEEMAAGIETTGGVYLVPGFVGLGAPYWDPEARGALLGLTRDSGAAEIARAALEAVCYQTRDLMDAMKADGAVPPVSLRVDGGLSANGWAMQFLSDILGVVVERPRVRETTALGAACLAGLGAGIYASLEEVAATWQSDLRWSPNMSVERRSALYEGWRRAVRRVLTSRS
ncbi:MAG: glycerol kinase GlpK [Gemmatimonadota bacterium]